MKYFSIPTPGGTASGRERLVDIIIKSSIPKLREKLLEALQAVLPIAAIVLVLCFSIAPVSPSILLCFLLGAAMIIVGIMFFTLGAEMSMTPMGERVGSMLTRSQNLFLIIGVGFLLGFLITISEPDLQVLANQVPSIPNMTLILSVAAGVGIFLVMAFLRMLLGIPLPRLLVIFYAVIFLLAAFVPKEFLAVAFDSGGVTTGPMTVPFIMALGVGVSAIRSDRHAADDSFGLVALCSVGPILAVLILGIVFNASESSYLPPVIPEVGDSVELWQLFSEGLPTYLHVPTAVKAMKKGIHVLSEKPISLKEEDIELAYSTAKENNVCFMIAQVLRFWPEYELIKELYDSGKYGKLLSGYMGRLGSYPAWSWDNWMMDEKRSGLVPYDLHIHDLDFLVYAFGKPEASLKHRAKQPNQDYLTAVYEFPGFFVTTEASWYASAYPFGASYRFQFEDALVTYEKGECKIYENNGSIYSPTEQATGDTGSINLPKSDAYAEEIKYFKNCVLSGQFPDKVKAEELRTVVGLLNEF